MLLVTEWFGSFLVDDGEVREKALFPKLPEEIAKRMQIVEGGGILEEERHLASKAENVQATEERLTALGAEIGETIARIDAADYGYDEGLLQQAMVVLGQLQVREVRSDLHLIQGVKAMDDITQTINLFTERLTEWCGYLMPSEPPEKIEKLLPLIADSGDMETLESKLGQAGVESMEKNMGEADWRAMNSLASGLVELKHERSSLERYIEETMVTLAPNLRTIAGPMVGARLISLAGGLDRLAAFPSSTVQVLGAEDAFFMHLKEGTAPPKHGIIFQHPLIHQSPAWQRGKLSRALAGKISIAAKMDNGRSGDISQELQTALYKRVNEIRTRCANPPKKKKKGGKRYKKKRR